MASPAVRAIFEQIPDVIEQVHAELAMSRLRNRFL
jgi:hypothetical protein